MEKFVQAAFCGAVAFALAGYSSFSEAAYKCNVGNTVVYQDKPCEKGSQKEIDIRTEDQKRWEQRRSAETANENQEKETHTRRMETS